METLSVNRRNILTVGVILSREGSLSCHIFCNKKRQSLYGRKNHLVTTVHDNQWTLRTYPVYENQWALRSSSVYENPWTLRTYPVYNNPWTLRTYPMYDNPWTLRTYPMYDNPWTLRTYPVYDNQWALRSSSVYEISGHWGPILSRIPMGRYMIYI